MTTVPSTSRSPRRAIARSMSAGGSALVPVKSNTSSTRESVVLTPCPPGPEDREKRHRSSLSGMAMVSVIWTGMSVSQRSRAVRAQRTSMSKIGRRRWSTVASPAAS